MRYILLAIVSVIIGIRVSGFLLINLGATLVNNAATATDLPEDNLKSATSLLSFATMQVDYGDRARRLLGLAHGMQEQEVEVIAAWERVSGMPSEVLAFSERAYRKGDYSEGLVWIKRGKSLAPALGEWLYYEALILRDTGRIEEAYSAMNDAVSLQSQHVGKSDIYYEIGWLQAYALDPPRYEESLGSLTRAITINDFLITELESALYHRGEVYRTQAEHIEAERDYRRVLSLNPDHYLANLRLGTLLWRQRGDEHESEIYLMRAIELAPDVKWAYRNLAQLLQEKGDVSRAILLYQRVLEIDPADVVAKGQLESLVGE